MRHSLPTFKPVAISHSSTSNMGKPSSPYRSTEMKPIEREKIQVSRLKTAPQQVKDDFLNGNHMKTNSQGGIEVSEKLTSAMNNGPESSNQHGSLDNEIFSDRALCLTASPILEIRPTPVSSPRRPDLPKTKDYNKPESQQLQSQQQVKANDDPTNIYFKQLSIVNKKRPDIAAACSGRNTDMKSRRNSTA